MQVVQVTEVPEYGLKSPRSDQTVFHTQYLLEGDEQSKDNFVFQLAKPKSFYSPRHRHNFDQVRLQLEGSTDYGHDGKMTCGMVGYFPEGTAYGPQTGSGDPHCVVQLQIGGISGQGYISQKQIEKAVAELKKQGTFEKGVYTVIDEQGQKHNKDGFEASWEFLTGRELKYPKPRYARPIMIQPENFDWISMPAADGVQEKCLGQFNHRRMTLSMLRLAAKAKFHLEGRNILFVLGGSGKIADRVWQTHTSIYLQEGEKEWLQANDDSEIFVIKLS